MGTEQCSPECVCETHCVLMSELDNKYSTRILLVTVVSPLGMSLFHQFFYKSKVS